MRRTLRIEPGAITSEAVAGEDAVDGAYGRQWSDMGAIKF